MCTSFALIYCVGDVIKVFWYVPKSKFLAVKFVLLKICMYLPMAYFQENYLKWGSPCGVVANVLDCDIVIRVQIPVVLLHSLSD